jgi:WD40 repeat protein
MRSENNVQVSTQTTSSVSVTGHYGSSQGVHSSCWLEGFNVVVGMGLKWIRVYNLKKPDAGPILTISTKSVFGLCSDPFDPFRFASYSDDGYIRIWDIRIPSDPLLTFYSDFRLSLLD